MLLIETNFYCDEFQISHDGESVSFVRVSVLMTRELCPYFARYTCSPAFSINISIHFYGFARWLNEAKI